MSTIWTDAFIFMTTTMPNSVPKFESSSETIGVFGSPEVFIPRGMTGKF